MGVVVAGVVGLVIMPWRAAPQMVMTLMYIGGALTPIAGILICDYYILRRRKINLNDLYTPNGQYRYWRNWNPAALIAYGAAIVVSIPFWSYLFITGIIVSGVVYYVLMKFWIVKVYPQPEITG
jgi:NCS1 family nucleobase:cation symporter-1